MPLGVPPANLNNGAADHFQPASSAYARGPVGPSSAGGNKLRKPLLTASSGWTKCWFQNGVGNKLTQVETDITWSWDGSCVSTVNAGGSYLWWSDWSFDSGSANTTADLNGASPGVVTVTCSRVEDGATDRTRA